MKGNIQISGEPDNIKIKIDMELNKSEISQFLEQLEDNLEEHLQD